MAVAYSGHYPPGSSGNHEAQTMVAYLVYALVATEAVAVVLDLRNLEYTWGDAITRLALALRDDGGFRPSAILAGGRTAEALQPLLGRSWPFGLAGTRLFDTMPEAVEHVVRALSGEPAATAPAHACAETPNEPPPPPRAGLETYWAYAFACHRSLEAILSAWNDAGPWRWEMRDSHWYGDYLSVRPIAGVRARIHEAFPAPGDEPPLPGPGFFARVWRALGRPLAGSERYSALLEIEPGSPATRAEIDGVLRGLLQRIGAKRVSEIEPYD